MGLRSPFPWFGGKRRCAHIVWDFFGDVPNFVDPCCGSLAVPLARPSFPRTETFNDRDCYLANFWRAVRWAPEELAAWADWPVNEADLHSRHRWLVEEAEFRHRMLREPFYFDAQIAGWWVWGISQWIGSGWCSRPEWMGRSLPPSPRGIQTDTYHQRPSMSRVRGLAGSNNWKKRPTLHRGNRGVNALFLDRRMPDLGGNSGATGKGVHRSSLQKITLIPPPKGGTANRQPDSRKGQWQSRPHLTSRNGVIALAQKMPALKTVSRGAGGRGGIFLPAKRPIFKQGHVGVLKNSLQLPQLSGDGSGSGRGVLSQAVGGNLAEYMRALSERLRRARVCCGDWKRVLGPSPTTCIGLTAIFFDPPYSDEAGRDKSIYNHESGDMAHAMADWARAHGDNPKLRIALCGYEGEHKMPRNWRCVPWKANGGYGNQSHGAGRVNAARERIWFSPHCLKAEGHA